MKIASQSYKSLQNKIITFFFYFNRCVYAIGYKTQICHAYNSNGLVLCFLGVQPVTVFTLQFTLLTKYKSCAKYKKCIFEMCPSNIYIANMHRVTRQYQFIALFWSKLNCGVIKCKLHICNSKFKNVTNTSMIKILIVYDVFNIDIDL